jgi:hypothetical protein
VGFRADDGASGNFPLRAPESAAARMGRVHALTVGSQQLHEIAMALASTAPAEQIGDGLLPTALFQSLYVNNR